MVSQIENWLPLTINFFLLVAITVHGIVYAIFLPETVAYHYDAYGVPDKTANTRGFIALYWFTALVSTVLMMIVSFIFSLTCCAYYCTSPEEASYSSGGRKYLRLSVAGWALWLNIAFLILVLTIFAVLLENARKQFEQATTLGVYLPFLIFIVGLIILVYWMVAHIQNAKGYMYAGFFGEDEKHDPQLPHGDGEAGTSAAEMNDAAHQDGLERHHAGEDHRGHESSPEDDDNTTNMIDFK